MSASQKDRKTHFESVFSNPKYQDAHIIILLLGFNDSRLPSPGISPEQTVANIHAICKVLGNMQKTVFVCPIANAGDDTHADSELLEQNMRRNEMILEYSTRGDKPFVCAGPKIDVMNYEYRVDRYYADDKQHFNAKGYEKLAKDFVDLIVNRMVQQEFKQFSTALGFGASQK
eukprot:jgi/Hompol1/725/HPOL_005397-RA